MYSGVPPDPESHQAWHDLAEGSLDAHLLTGLLHSQIETVNKEGEGSCDSHVSVWSPDRWCGAMSLPHVLHPDVISVDGISNNICQLPLVIDQVVNIQLQQIQSLPQFCLGELWPQTLLWKTTVWPNWHWLSSSVSSSLPVLVGVGLW